MSSRRDKHKPKKNEHVSMLSVENYRSSSPKTLTDSLGFREVTLKSDTKPATIAFRSRVAEMCKAEVTSVKEEKRSNRLNKNIVML